MNLLDRHTGLSGETVERHPRSRLFERSERLWVLARGFFIHEVLLKHRFHETLDEEPFSPWRHQHWMRRKRGDVGLGGVHDNYLRLVDTDRLLHSNSCERVGFGDIGA